MGALRVQVSNEVSALRLVARAMGLAATALKIRLHLVIQAGAAVNQTTQILTGAHQGAATKASQVRLVQKAQRVVPLNLRVGAPQAKNAMMSGKLTAKWMLAWQGRFNVRIWGYGFQPLS